jgi:hypothetical protein
VPVSEDASRKCTSVITDSISSWRKEKREGSLAILRRPPAAFLPLYLTVILSIRLIPD